MDTLFSGDIAEYTDIKINSFSEPYIAFKDDNHSSKSSVMRFTGQDWIYVGDPGFSLGLVRFTSLAFSPTGDPFVAFYDALNQAKTTVMKYADNEWQYVGGPGISAGMANKQNLVFNPVTGNPYVAFEDYSVANKASVMMFDSQVIQDEIENLSLVSISPNPFHTQAKIEIENFTLGETLEFYLFDFLGRVVYRTTITSSPYILKRQGLPDGMYLWKIVGGEGIVAKKLVIK